MLTSTHTECLSSIFLLPFLRVLKENSGLPRQQIRGGKSCNHSWQTLWTICTIASVNCLPSSARKRGRDIKFYYNISGISIASFVSGEKHSLYHLTCKDYIHTSYMLQALWILGGRGSNHPLLSSALIPAYVTMFVKTDHCRPKFF